MVEYMEHAEKIIKKACNFLGGKFESRKYAYRAEKRCTMELGGYKLIIRTAKSGIEPFMNFEILKESKGKDSSGNPVIQRLEITSHDPYFGVAISDVKCSETKGWRACTFSNEGDIISIGKMEESGKKSTAFAIDIRHKDEPMGFFFISEEELEV